MSAELTTLSYSQPASLLQTCAMATKHTVRREDEGKHLFLKGLLLSTSHCPHAMAPEQLSPDSVVQICSWIYSFSAGARARLGVLFAVEKKAKGHLSAFATLFGGRTWFSQQVRARAVTWYLGLSTIFEINLSVSLGRSREQSLTLWNFRAMKQCLTSWHFISPWGSSVRPGHQGKVVLAVLRKLTYDPKASALASYLASFLGWSAAGTPLASSLLLFLCCSLKKTAHEMLAAHWPCSFTGSDRV